MWITNSALITWAVEYEMILNVLDSLDQQFQAAVLLADNGEYDQANQALLECVMADPGCVEFVEEFLANLLRKFATPEHAPISPTSPTAAPPVGNETANRSLALRRNLRQLALNPWQVPILLAIAEIEEAAGHDAAAAKFLQLAWATAPQEIEVNRRYGQLLGRLEKFTEALVCWERVEHLQPEDTEAAHHISQLTIQKSRQRFGFGSPALSAAAHASQEPHSPAKKKLPLVRFVSGRASLPAPTEGAEIKRTPIQQLEHAIRERPGTPEFYLQLTPLYLEIDRDYDAERLLAKGREATDDEPRVRQLWEEVTMLRLEKKIAAARERVAEHATDEAQAALAEACAERDRLETQIFLHRCEREPENAALRLELGLRLKQAGKVEEAAERFKEALPSPEQKCFAAFQLAECLREESDFPSAFRSYQLAIESANRPQQLECKKQSLYQAGCLAQRLKLRKLAHRYFAELVKLDPHYQDATARLELLQK